MHKVYLQILIIALIYSFAKAHIYGRKFKWNKSNTYLNRNDYNFIHKTHLNSKENGIYIL
jgi:hypothetical protein